MKDVKKSSPLENILKNTVLSIAKASICIFLGLFIWNNFVSGSVSYILSLNFPKLDIVSWIVYYALSSIAFTILDRKTSNKGNEEKNLYSTFVSFVLSIVPSFFIWNKILVPVMLSSFDLSFPVIGFLEFLVLNIALIFMNCLLIIPLTIVIFIGVLIHSKIKKT